MNYSGADWTTELRDYGEISSILDELIRIGGDKLAYQPTTNPQLMNALGYEGNHYSPYATTYGSEGAYGNFTPIQYDYDADELIKVLSKAELDKYAQDVMSGARQDDLGLRLNGGYNYPTYDEALADAIKTNYLKKTVEAQNERMTRRFRESQENRFDEPGYREAIPLPSTNKIKAENIPNAEIPQLERGTRQEGLDILKSKDSLRF